MYTAGFEPFLFDQIFKRWGVFYSIQISLMKKHPIKVLNHQKEETIKKIKLLMNEHEIFLLQVLVLVNLDLSYL